MFEFNNNVLKLSFPGAEFEISSIDAQIGLNKITDKIPKMEEEVLSGRRSVEKACEEIVSDIDSILGKDACKAIFGERKVKYEDLADIVAYISHKCNEFLKSKANAYNQKNKQNKYPQHPVHKGGKKHV